MNKELCCICKGKKRNPISVYYYGKGICQAHFDMGCEGFIDLKKVLKIKEKTENPIVPNFFSSKTTKPYTRLYTRNRVYTHTHAGKMDGEALKLTNFT